MESKYHIRYSQSHYTTLAVPVTTWKSRQYSDIYCGKQVSYQILTVTLYDTSCPCDNLEIKAILRHLLWKASIIRYLQSHYTILAVPVTTWKSKQYSDIYCGKQVSYQILTVTLYDTSCSCDNLEIKAILIHLLWKASIISDIHNHIIRH